MKNFSHLIFLFTISISLLLILLLFFFFTPSFFLIPHPPLPSTHRVLLAMEEKARLGSTPPSCYNKCNGCHPCLAVQVPSWPTTFRRRRGRHSSAAPAEFFDPAPSSSGYSNYKPLGWKCRCRNHLFNP